MYVVYWYYCVCVVMGSYSMAVYRRCVCYIRVFISLTGYIPDTNLRCSVIISCVDVFGYFCMSMVCIIV